MNICPKTSNDAKSLLVVGSAVPASAADLQTGAIHIARRDTVPQAIAAMRREHFDSVAVSLDTLRDAMESSLTGLRQADPDARIILLAGMLDEPRIMDLMHSARPTRRLFDDYLICPVNIQQITQTAPSLTPSRAVTNADADKDRRIEELEKLVIQDDLTGLKNRRYIRQFLPQILDLASRHRLRVTLLTFDIDDFKHYNDDYGHAVGDNVLQQAGRMIQRCCRSHDIVARLGGDEFAVIFWDLPTDKQLDRSGNPNTSDRRTAALEHPREPIFMAERFCKELSQAAFDFIGPKGKGALTISGGLATFPTDAETPEDLFQKADQAMLEAKRSGKNRIYLVGQPA